jgi:hypothetical protein
VLNPYGDPNKYDPYGNKGNYLNNASPNDNTEEDLKKLQQEIYLSKNISDPYKDLNPLGKLRMDMTQMLNNEEEYLTPYDVSPPPKPSDHEK